MTAIFNNRLLKHRFGFIWDIEKVLSYLNTLPDNGNLLIKVLTQKLKLLCNLDTRGTVKTDTKFIFTFTILTKTCRKGKSPMPDELSLFITVQNYELLKLSNPA